jgi:hypothetical protein
MSNAIDAGIVGATIVAIRPMTKEEMDNEGWRKNEIPSCLVLSSGTILYPSMDTEGNDAGALFGLDKEGQAFGLY